MPYFRRDNNHTKIPGEIFVGKYLSHYKRDKEFDKTFCNYIVP